MSGIQVATQVATRVALRAGLLVAISGTAAFAQSGVAPGGSGSAPPAQEDSAENAKRLQSIESDLDQASDRRRQLEADVAQAKTDRLTFNAALLDKTARVREAQARIADSRIKLQSLTDHAEAIEQSLRARRGVIADVLAALQRIGRHVPPAILTRPNDILSAVRSAVLLGAILPEMREEAQTLAADLAELSRTRSAMEADRDKLEAEVAALDAESNRLRGLIDARQQAQVAAESDLGVQSARMASLARQAGDLKDLIARSETGLAAARRAAEAAKAAELAQQRAAEADAASVQTKVAAGIFHDPARLAPAVAFADTKGLLPLPVAGRVVKTYGQPDEFGGTEKGLSIAAPAKAIVSASSDAWVAFSGPYRTYGQVLILNLGGGYYNVLAGMDHVDVAPGQFVLSGEPLGTMGDGSVKTASALALGASEPILYVELRKDGAAIDPNPWWAKAALEKVRG